MFKEMIRGTQRQMIMVRTSKSRMFETAYFVLRTTANEDAGEGDMIAEANRIIAEACGTSGKRKRERRIFSGHRILAFLAGSLSGGALTAIIWIFSSIF